MKGTKRDAMTPDRVVLILALLLGLQPVTTDLYLPGLPALTTELQGTVNQAQLTLSGLLLSFGLAQLVFGPVSDRFGRRPVLLAGLSLYGVAAIGSCQASSMESLLVWRILQGAALGAGVVCARAVVRDLYTPAFGAQILSRGLSGLGVIACLSLPLGGALAHWFGWRAALLAVVLFGLGTLVVIFRSFRETLSQPDPEALRPRKLLNTWAKVLRNRRFWAFALVAACTYGGLFTFLASSSFVFIELLGVSRLLYGVMMFSMAFAYLLGTYLCRALLRRFSLQNTVVLGGVFSLLGGTLIGCLSLAGVESAATILLPVWVFMLGHGILQPCGQAGAVGPFPEAAGAASALSGCLMMVLAFGMGQWLGWQADGTALPMTMGIWFWSAVTALVAWGLVRPQPHS